jgi:polysaccharide biosynthesis PFTS motif protein
METKKIVFFEELNSAYNSILKGYIKRGFEVYCLRIDNRFKEKKDTKINLNSGKLVDASSKMFKFELYRKAVFLAYKNIEEFFNIYFPDIQSIKEMEKLIGTNKIVDTFKRELLFDLKENYFTELEINEIIEGKKNLEKIDFVTQNSLKLHKSDFSILEDRIEIIKLKNFRLKLKKYLTILFIDDLKTPKKGMLLLFYPIFLLIKKFGGIKRGKKSKEFRVGISVTKGLFTMNFFLDTIFIDSYEMPKRDVLFIDESGQENIEGYLKGGYNYIRLRDDRVPLSSKLVKKIIKVFIPIWAKTILLSLKKEPFFFDSKRKILQDYILWSIFTETYKVKNYIKRLIPDALSRIHLLRATGTKTFLVYPDNDTYDYYLDWDESLENEEFYSFMHYDVAMIYGDKFERYIKKHRNQINKYVKTGVIFSQIVRELEDGKLKSNLITFIKGNNFPKKIIGVFDTSYGRETPLRSDDGIQFGKDILKLLEDYPDIGVIFKAKKELELTPFLVSTYKQLENHERCIFFARYDQEGISAPEVISVSDLVVSASFTSPTAEALGARKKAIYYDVSGKYKGERFYYNRFPNFVAHSYEELKILINYWLYDVTEEEFNNFLNTYVKDEIDPYLDGKALSRLRKMLMEP